MCVKRTMHGLMNKLSGVAVGSKKKPSQMLYLPIYKHMGIIVHVHSWMDSMSLLSTG